MELPLGGPSLRHYTQSRPRPHRQKLNHRPSRPQEPIIESENETVEHMGRVDEGVEEFFTKRVLPADSLKSEDETSPPTVEESIRASAASGPPPTKTLRRKLGDFFTLRKRRGPKAETSQEGRSKKVSIADLIRPLREAARADRDKHKVRESEKDDDKENDTERRGEKGDGAATGERAVEEMPGPGSVTLRRDAAPPPRRALREGKSQSLILLSGSAAAPGTGGARHAAKKTFDGQHSFEQKLSLMLQRIGVTKSPPAEEQNPEGEMKKADSEGTIIDNKPEPPPTFSKPWTMSTSSEARPQIRQSASAHESAGKPALPPKPIIKPGPPQPTASGRSTPENELAKIQEAETSAPGEACPPDPPASSSPLPPCPVLSTPSPPTAPSTSTSIPHSDTVTASPPAPAGPPSDTAARPEPVELEAKCATDASPPVPVDGGAAVAATQPSAAGVTDSPAETLSPGPASGAAATVPPASPLSPTAITIPTTSSETLSPLPASSTSFESITSTPLSPPATTTTTTTTTSTTTPSVTSSVSASISESSASAMPPSTLTHSPLPVPDGAITNCTASASVSPVTSSDTTAVDTASVVSAGVFQDTPSSPTTPSAHTTAHPDLTPTTDTFTSSETPAPSVVTPAQVLVEASSFCKTTEAIPSTVSTASSHAATPATASVTSPVSTDGTNSVSPSPSTQPGPPIPSDTTNTSFPMSPASGSTHATHPSIASTTTSISTVHSETPSSVNLPVTNNQGATHLSSISTSEATEAPPVTVPKAASPDSTSPAYNSQAEVINVQTPPEEKPRHYSTMKEKAADDDNDSDVQRSERNERNGNSQEDRGGQLPDAEGEKARRRSEREDFRSAGDGAVADGPGPGAAQAPQEEQQNGTEAHREAEPQQDETNSLHEK